MLAKSGAHASETRALAARGRAHFREIRDRPDRSWGRPWAGDVNSVEAAICYDGYDGTAHARWTPPRFGMGALALGAHGPRGSGRPPRRRFAGAARRRRVGAERRSR